MFNIKAHTNSKDQLRTYSDVGMYPMFYVTAESQCLCPDCANDVYHNVYDESDGSLVEIVGADANWENPELFCDCCGNRIESAYAEEEGE